VTKIYTEFVASLFRKNNFINIPKSTYDTQKAYRTIEPFELSENKEHVQENLSLVTMTNCDLPY
jgi:hypothetical protein